MDRFRFRMAHHAIRALVLGGTSLYIIRLAQTNALPRYIEPDMALYVKLAALGLTCMAGVQAALAFRTRSERRAAEACGCVRPLARSAWKSFSLYAVFVIPLLWGLLTLPPSSSPAGPAFDLPPAPEDAEQPDDPFEWYKTVVPFEETDADFGLGE